jgi:hypothetical protein
MLLAKGGKLYKAVKMMKPIWRGSDMELLSSLQEQKGYLVWITECEQNESACGTPALL